MAFYNSLEGSKAESMSVEKANAVSLLDTMAKMHAMHNPFVPKKPN